MSEDENSNCQIDTRDKQYLPFDRSLINELFPFSISFDDGMITRFVGISIKKIEPQLEACVDLRSIVKIISPKVEIDFQALNDCLNVPHTWQLHSGLKIRGQLFRLSEKETYFLCAPLIVHSDQLKQYGLVTSDFAFHDLTLDYLFMNQSQKSLVADCQRMIARVNESENERQKLEDLQEKLGFELNLVCDLKTRFSADGRIIDIQWMLPKRQKDTRASLIGSNIFEALPFLKEGLKVGIEALSKGLDQTSFTFSIPEETDTRYFDARMAKAPNGNYLLLGLDVTKAHKLKLQLERRANYDHLTGLENRAYFLEQAQLKLDDLTSSDTEAAIMIIDLDHFKEINDRYGHAAGDFTLCSIAETLSSHVRSGDLTARLSGDEFAIFAQDFQSRQKVNEMANRICRAFEKPISYKGSEFKIGCSIGLSFVDSAEEPIVSQIQHADLALYEAKSKGRGQVVVYQDGMYEEYRNFTLMRDNLQKAIDAAELTVAFQPIVMGVSSKIVGYEALARWLHPDEGYISPEKFIRVAEESGLMIQLGRRLISESLGQWKRASNLIKFNNMILSINISANQLYDKSFHSYLEEKVRSKEVNAANIMLEITETALIHDFESAIVVLNNLKNLGFSLALDDFGTGFSSLSYLDKLPFDVLKIDRSFVSNVTTDQTDSPLLESIVKLAEIMGLRVIAEGVQTKLQQEILNRLGCEYSQGFYYGKPVFMDDLLNDQEGSAN